MLDVIDLFREKETRDELGIGVVRDAFADMLFPGTSTIQTRARYFLFIPWVYRGLERKRVGSARIAAEARKREVALTRAIVGSGDSRGVFGKQAGVGLKRFASSVYWQGLGTWGIRIFPGSQDQYHRSLDAFYKLGEQGERTDDGEPVGEAVVQNWHGGLPPEPAGFLESSSLELSKRDAQYLRERIMASVPDTLLAFLVDTGDELDPLDLNPTQIKALLSAARGDRLEALYVFAIHTGLRRSEILGLTWTDVDLEAGVLSVQRSLDTNGTFNPPKRNKSRRTVKLTDQAIEALKGHRARQNEERLRLGSL